MLTVTASGSTEVSLPTATRTRSATCAAVLDDGLGQQDAELLAAEPGDDVLRPDPGGDDLRDQFQRLVAAEVAVPLVVEPEVVDVGEQHRPRSADARSAGGSRRVACRCQAL